MLCRHVLVTVSELQREQEMTALRWERTVKSCRT
jgi:hypothetical protein